MQIADDSNFCPHCGGAQRELPQESPQATPLNRIGPSGRNERVGAIVPATTPYSSQIGHERFDLGGGRFACRGQKSIIALAVLSIFIVLIMAPPVIDKEYVDRNDEDLEDEKAYWRRQSYEDFIPITVVFYVMIIGIGAGSIWKESKEVSGIILLPLMFLTIGGFSFIGEAMESIGWYMLIANTIFLILLLVVYYEKEAREEPRPALCTDCGREVMSNQLSQNRCPECYQRFAAAAYRYRSGWRFP
jgi:predicted RNA-binding Zn-ribbon protein involved in translation (DUF1610 family)